MFLSSTTTAIREGDSDDVCVRLIAGDGSPDMLANDLTVSLSTVNDQAGIQTLIFAHQVIKE